MGLENVKNTKLLYHLTALENLESIIEHGLLPRKSMLEAGLIFNDVASTNIISKRTLLGLDKYTPFHFHPYSSFDVAVKREYANTDFIYLCILREDAENNAFKIITTHPLSLDKCNLLDYVDGFEQIDWETMSALGTEDVYMKHVKMAECLTELKIDVNNFQSICVSSNKIKEEVESKLLQKLSVDQMPYIDVRPWV